MGFLQNTAQFELVAKLTPQGRRKLATSSNTLITSFSLGDSDSYYVSLSGLTGGQVPAISGNGNGVDTSNGGTNYKLRSTLNLNGSTDKKPVDPASISVTSSFEHVGYKTIQYSGNGITQNQINLNDTQTDPLTNLFYSFSLPTSASDFNTYTGITSGQGGFSNTSFSGIAQTNILVIGIDVSQYSELIDGKSIKLEMETSASTYNIYGTYERKPSPLTSEDLAVSDSATSVSKYGPNRVMLFSDSILKPNGGDATKSWATGYSQSKPFSVNGKERFNSTINPTSLSPFDKPVGIGYLDKGFLVITEPTIVDSYNSTYSGATGTTITFDTVRNKVSQSITCIANRGEFGVSNNPTWSAGDTPRITEVALFDASNTLIAIGKLNRPYEKSTDDFIAFNITIEY